MAGFIRASCASGKNYVPWATDQTPDSDWGRTIEQVKMLIHKASFDTGGFERIPAVMV